MAVNIVVAIGGTGSRCAEAFVYAASTGVLRDDTRTIVFIVDKDEDCGNTQRLDSTLSEYNQMRLCTGLSMPEITKENWCITEAMQSINPHIERSATYRETAVAPGTDDALLVDLMHSEEEQGFDLQFGFYGHPSLGAAIYGLITNTEVFQGSRNRLMDTIKRELADGNEVHVFLMGSIFGGTGASLFPNVAHSLQSRFGKDPKFKLGGGMMLPYFTFDVHTRDGRQTTVSPETFLEKTATALRYYAKDKQLVRTDDRERSDDAHKPAVFDALYLLGLVPLEPTCSVYAEGGGDQLHSFSVADLYAAISAVEFFNDDNIAPAKGNPYIYTAELSTRAIGWPQLPNWELRPRAEQMMRFCAAFLEVLYPMFLRSTPELASYQFLINLYGAAGGIFSHKAKLPEGMDFAKTVELIVPFCLKYMKFWQDLQNRQDIPVKLFTVTLNQMTTYLSDSEGDPNTRAWFEANFGTLRTEVFKPNDLLLEPRATAVDDAVALQQELRKYPLDTHLPELQPIYRAAYDIMK